jgi:hypothetical protein
MAKVKAWLRQVTTGHGFMMLAGAGVALLAGTISWQAALPVMIAGLVGLIWPEDAALQTGARQAATDIIAAVESGQPSGVGAGSSGTTAATARALGIAFALTALAGLSLLAACSAPDAVDATACVAQAAPGVVADAQAPGVSDGQKAVNAGLTVAASPACQKAAADGVVDASKAIGGTGAGAPGAAPATAAPSTSPPAAPAVVPAAPAKTSSLSPRWLFAAVLPHWTLGPPGGWITASR